MKRWQPQDMGSLGLLDVLGSLDCAGQHHIIARSMETAFMKGSLYRLMDGTLREVQGCLTALGRGMTLHACASFVDPRIGKVPMPVFQVFRSNFPRMRLTLHVTALHFPQKEISNDRLASWCQSPGASLSS